ncbi:helix-turn-helix domain-containing protein [Vibrio sp. TBV020]|uniref:helix-turn-helix domain-containing protein n=1 Tax=Vibrio sp. TBV020 TaxID=3137398 RepID=UPI0038CD45DE
MLAYLFVHTDEPKSIESISRAIRADSLDNQSSLRVLIFRTRKKINNVIKQPLIETCHRKGYRIGLRFNETLFHR